MKVILNVSDIICNSFLLLYNVELYNYYHKYNNSKNKMRTILIGVYENLCYLLISCFY